MSVDNKTANSESKLVYSSEKQQSDNKNTRHEHFSLQSSQTQPYDSDRMTGRPTSSDDKTTSDNVSRSDK